MSKTLAHPLHGLGVHLGDVSLVYPDEHRITAVSHAVLEPIHRPGWMPFGHAWSHGEPEDVQRALVEHLHSVRDAAGVDRWTLPLVVVIRGESIGVQAITGENFLTERTVSTGSWLAAQRQGQGIGTLIRLMALALAFDGLGAQRATTSARHDNAASIAVTSKVGYTHVETFHKDFADAANVETWKFAMTADQWATNPRKVSATLTGLESAKHFLGIA